jgi:hypothetical protein
MDNYYVSFLCFVNKVFCPERRMEVVNVFGEGMLKEYLNI